jgi:peptidoglycan/LPS O-acetylase OafA/YrhL
MRALAVAMVVVYHLWPSMLPGGFTGVDVFFVISGFLITGHLQREYAGTGTIRLVDFWGRRARRLMPAAALVLTVTWLASRLLLPATRLADTASQILASALYFQNWRLAWNAVNYLDANVPASPVQHFWSLSVEEQFYLGWPLLFLLAALTALAPRSAWSRRTRNPEELRRRGHLAMLALAALVVAASLCYSVYDTNTDPAAAYFVTTTRIWELGLGGIIALLPARVSARLGRYGALGWAGLALVIAAAFTLSGSGFPGLLALLPAGGAALLILGGSAGARFGPARLTSARPMVFTGGISYSLYLWHWPLIVLWTARSGHPPGWRSGSLIIVVSVLLSWATKVWVEDKVRTARILAGHSWRSVSMALAAALPVALTAAFILAQPGPWNGPLGPNYPGAAALTSKVSARVAPAPVLPPVSDIALPAYWQQGCLVAENSGTPKECVYGDTKDPALTVALVGDSIAGDWFTPLAKIATERHWKLVTDLHANCPFTATMLIMTGDKPYTSCSQWGAAALHQLISSVRPQVVITSDNPSLGTLEDPTGGAQAQREIASGMDDYWDQLQSHGISVIAIEESPQMPFYVPDCVAKHLHDLPSCSVSRSTAVKPDLPTVYATRATAGTVPLIDMNSLICAPTECPAVTGNVLVYQDTHHLTSDYALTMAPYLEQRLLAASKLLAAAG